MGLISTVCGYIVAFIVLGYLIPHFIISLLPKQDLKKKARMSADCLAERRLNRAPRGRGLARQSCQRDSASWHAAGAVLGQQRGGA